MRCASVGSRCNGFWSRQRAVGSVERQRDVRVARQTPSDLGRDGTDTLNGGVAVAVAVEEALEVGVDDHGAAVLAAAADGRPPGTRPALDAQLEAARRRSGSRTARSPGPSRARMVVAAGPPHHRRLHQGVGILRQLRPQEAALVVEADETAPEVSGRIRVGHTLDVGRQLDGPAAASSAPRPGPARRRSRAWRRRPGGRTHRASGALRRARRTSAGRLLSSLRRLDQPACPGAAHVEAGDQPVGHGERAVAPPGLRSGELGDLTEHGALVLGDHTLVPGDALGQLRGTRVASVVTGQGTGAGVLGGGGRRGLVAVTDVGPPVAVELGSGAAAMPGERSPGAGRRTGGDGSAGWGAPGRRVPAYGKTTVLLPLSSTRSSRCQRRPRASTVRSTSRPTRCSSSTESAWSMRRVSCSMIGPSSSSAVT